VVKASVSGRLESFLSLFMADAMGEFEKENIDLELATVPPSEAVLLLAKGQLDVVPSSSSAGNFNLLAQSNELRAVFPLNAESTAAQSGFWVRKDALGGDGFQPSDLKGKRVLTPSGSGSFSVAYFGVNVLRPAGISATDVTWERFGVADSAPALINGSAPAALLLTPFWDVVAKDGCCEFIDGYPRSSFSHYYFGPTLLEERPEVGQAFARAIARTTRAYLQGDYHNDPVIGPRSAELLEQPLEHLRAQPSPVWEASLPLEILKLTEIQEFFRDAGLLSYDKPLTGADLFDDRFVTPLRKAT
jgi:NitT/TauT family transport system substrate-binding protein